MKRKHYWKGLEVDEMADWLDLDLWGYAQDGKLRVSERVHGKTGLGPTRAMTHEEVKKAFEKHFKVSPVRKGSNLVAVTQIRLCRVCGKRPAASFRLDCNECIEQRQGRPL